MASIEDNRLPVVTKKKKKKKKRPAPLRTILLIPTSYSTLAMRTRTYPSHPACHNSKTNMTLSAKLQGKDQKVISFS